MRSRPTLVVAASALLAAGLLAGCTSASGSTAGQGGSGGSGGRLEVTASFYPLAYAVEQVGGDDVTVTSLTRPGAEPHDLELTPRQVAGLTESALVVYEKGFQPAVDDAVTQLGSSATAFDVSRAADLDLTIAADDEGEDESGRQTIDPHFWLDPVRYSAVVKALATELAAKDPAHASAYASRATAFEARLSTLDEQYRTGLASCRNTNIVTGHAAFGYLAKRYGLTQVSVAGVSPDEEPNATSMKDIVRTVEDRKVTTVYAETLVSPALVDTIARETGAAVKVLDPIEGITKSSAGTSYLEVMESNLATLRTGQQCR